MEDLSIEDGIIVGKREAYRMRPIKATDFNARKKGNNETPRTI